MDIVEGLETRADKTLITFICDGDERNAVQRRLFDISDMVTVYEINSEQQDTQ